jgi:hypothetical protein
MAANTLLRLYQEKAATDALLSRIELERMNEKIFYENLSHLFEIQRIEMTWILARMRMMK